MSGYDSRGVQYVQASGCLIFALAIGLLCLMPIVMVDVMRSALAKLHLEPGVAGLALVGIFLGSLINLPLYRIPREQDQVYLPLSVYGLGPWSGRWQRVRHETIIAVNVGGCIVPSLLAVWQVLHVAEVGGWPLRALVLCAAVNVAACYYLARPVRGVGIMMPAFASPALAVGLAWLLLGGAAYDPVRAPIAFVAGVAGPVIGADLLHLKDIARISSGMLSIGGAGTFDGIVISGLAAALLA